MVPSETDTTLATVHAVSVVHVVPQLNNRTEANNKI
jgi:hypothetical protein